MNPKWIAVTPALILFLLLLAPVCFAGLFGGDTTIIIKKPGSGDANVQFSCNVGYAVQDYNSKSGLYTCVSVGAGGDSNLSFTGGNLQEFCYWDSNKNIKPTTTIIGADTFSVAFDKNIGQLAINNADINLYNDADNFSTNLSNYALKFKANQVPFGLSYFGMGVDNLQGDFEFLAYFEKHNFIFRDANLLLEKDKCLYFDKYVTPYSICDEGDTLVFNQPAGGQAVFKGDYYDFSQASAIALPYIDSAIVNYNDINGLHLNQNGYEVCDKSGNCPFGGIDTNWETSWATFDANMKATYYTQSQSDVNWNKYVKTTDFNSNLSPQSCPAGQALRILGATPTCVSVGGTDTNLYTAGILRTDNNAVAIDLNLQTTKSIYNIKDTNTIRLNIDLNGSINLPTTTDATSGVIKQNDAVIFSTFRSNSVFIGVNAGNFTTNTGNSNMCFGTQACQSLTSGTGNAGVGSYALRKVTGGGLNIAVGNSALENMTSGGSNVGIGQGAGLGISTTSFNTAVGADSLGGNSGVGNTAVGRQALYYGNNSYNTSIGYNSGITATGASGSYQTFIGWQAGYTDGTTTTPNNLTNATAIGAGAQVGASNSLVLGGTGTYAVNAGVGTTTPKNKWNVVGDINASGVNGRVMADQNVSAGTIFIAKGVAGIDKNITVMKTALTTCDINIVGGIIIASTC